MSPKKVHCRCFTCVNVPYHVFKEIVKLNGTVFKSKPVKIEDAKIKPKARSQQYTSSGSHSNPVMQK